MPREERGRWVRLPRTPANNRFSHKPGELPPIPRDYLIHHPLYPANRRYPQTLPQLYPRQPEPGAFILNHPGYGGAAFYGPLQTAAFGNHAGQCQSPQPAA